MRIGELAERTGASVRSLRHYESRGLVSADRTGGGHRDYPAGAVDRVILIQELLAAGLTTAVIATLMPCIHSGITTQTMLTDLQIHREAIDRRARELMATRDRLDGLINDATTRLAREA